VQIPTDYSWLQSNILVTSKTHCCVGIKIVMLGMRSCRFLVAWLVGLFDGLLNCIYFFLVF
jgi:hypothetical protein